MFLRGNVGSEKNNDVLEDIECIIVCIQIQIHLNHLGDIHLDQVGGKELKNSYHDYPEYHHYHPRHLDRGSHHVDHYTHYLLDQQDLADE